MGPPLQNLGGLLIRSVTRWSLLPVPVLDLFSDGIRGRVIGLDPEDLTIGRDLSLRDPYLLPLKLHNPDRMTTVDLFDPHRLA